MVLHIETISTLNVDSLMELFMQSKLFVSKSFQLSFSGVILLLVQQEGHLACEKLNGGVLV